MWAIMDQKLARYRELEDQLADPALAADMSRFTAAAKEHGRLAKLVKPYLEFIDLDRNVTEARKWAEEADPEMQEMGKSELASIGPRYESLRQWIEDQLLIDPNEDFDSLIMEIRAGTGGDEA